MQCHIHKNTLHHIALSAILPAGKLKFTLVNFFKKGSAVKGLNILVYWYTIDIKSEVDSANLDVSKTKSFLSGQNTFRMSKNCSEETTKSFWR